MKANLLLNCLGLNPDLISKQPRPDSVSSPCRCRILATLLLCLTLGVGKMWGAKITSYSNIVSGKVYFIGATISSTDYYFCASEGIATSASNLSGTAVTDKFYATPVVITISGTSGTIQFLNGNHMYLPNSNGKYQSLTTSQTWTFSNVSGPKIRLTNNSRALERNNTAGTYVFGSYASTQTDIWLEEATMYTVSWSVNGGACSGSPATRAASGQAVYALPTPPTSSDCDGSKSFVGWTASPIVGTQNTAPADLFADLEDAPAVTANVTYYAVFANRSGAGSAKWKVTTTLSAGKKYVMGAVKAAASTTLANNTTIGAVTFSTIYSSTSWGQYSDVTPNSDGVISTANVTSAMKWKLVSITSGNYAFKKGSNYLYLKSGSTGSNTCGLNTTANVYLEDVSSTCKDAFKLHPVSNPSSANKLLLNTGNNYGYRMYSSGQGESASMCPYIRFYEYDDGYTYSAYATTCCTPLGSINGSFF